MSGFADRAGAVLGDDGRVLHYGNPMAEQRALARGAVVGLPHRAVLVLRGADRLTWLDSISSQQLIGLLPGESAETLILSPQGRIEHQLRLVDDGEALWAIVDADHAEALQAWLERMVFMRDVQITRERAQVIGYLGERTPPETIVEWTDPWPGVVAGGHRSGSGDLEWSWREAIVPMDWQPAEAAGTLALEAARIAAGRPSLGEVDEASIPHELDWLATAVHLTKGCYRGQETVAKVHNLGAPPRRVTLLHLDGSDAVLPSTGDEVRLGETRVGQVTTAAMHAELGPIALALLKRNVDPAAPLVVLADGVEVAAAQEVLVPPDAGRNAPPPRLPKLGSTRRPRPGATSQ